MDKLTRNKISYVNFVLSLFIIWHHTYNVDVYNLELSFFSRFEDLLLNLTEAAVPMFFFLSAFLFYYNLNEGNILDKLKRRIPSLIFPYLIWNLIGYLYFQIINLFPYMKENYSGTITDFNIVEMIRQMFIGDYNHVTWFLSVLIVYTFVFPIFYKLLKNKYFAHGVLILTLCLNNIGFKDVVPTFACYYYFGVLVGIHYKELIQREYNLRTKLTAFFILVSSLLSYTLFNIEYESFLGKACYILMVIALWIIFDYLRTDKEPCWWMKQNLVFYCGHEFILEPVEKIIYILIGSSLFGAIIDYFLAPPITILILILIVYILKKIPFLYGLLTGYRKS